MKIDLIRKLYTKKIKNSKDKSYIELYINNEADLFNKYSIYKKDAIMNNNLKINSEIIDYLINETKIMPIKNVLGINVKIAEKINCDTGSINKLIKDNIYEKITIIDRKIKKININSFILAWIGMMLIGITHIFHFFEQGYPLNEFIIVMSWVFMWKAVDLMFFERAELMKEKGIL